jgi:tetratricopeptide (TPR) repeat protein
MNFRARFALVGATLASIAMLAACVAPPARRSPVHKLEPIRLSELASVGDPARRASNRLLVTALDYDIDSSPTRALGTYQRALQVDPTNPYAYLAIARHRIEYDDPEGALALLDQAESLLRSSGDVSPRVSVHVTGLRGRALYNYGEAERGARLLTAASKQAPGTWSDGYLSARELR